MSNLAGPWKLCSSELDKEFQIVDVTGFPIAKMLIVNSAVKPWLNKTTPPWTLWKQLTNKPERAKTNAMVAAPELLEQLQKAHRFLRKSGYDMTEIDSLITKITGEA